MKRKICVITGSRADYGILKPLIEEIQGDKYLSLQLVVTGMHLLKEFGLTYREIDNEGFSIKAKVRGLLNSDQAKDIVKSMGKLMGGFAGTFQRLSPDIVVGLGDRFELMSAVVAAHVMCIPVAHIGGGDKTLGVIDDAFRHSMTKMSQWHFVSNEEARRRVIQLGEDPERVFDVGEIALDNIGRRQLLSRSQLEKELDIKFNKHNLLITFHPVTLERDTSGKQFDELLKALKELKDTHMIFTRANADVYGRIINRKIDTFVKKSKGKAYAFPSLGSLRYLSLIKDVDAVVGNSSSGMIETPCFKKGTINIGDRQKGRPRVASILDCAPKKSDILKSLRILYSQPFQKKLKTFKHPYGAGRSAYKIKEKLKTVQLNNTLKKGFFDKC